MADKTVELRFVGTQKMVADVLTKPLPRVQFQRLRELMGLRCSPLAAEEECQKK